jgi:hypothetical protein
MKRSAIRVGRRKERSRISLTLMRATLAVLIYGPALAGDQGVRSWRWQLNLTFVIIGPIDHLTKIRP